MIRTSKSRKTTIHRANVIDIDVASVFMISLGLRITEGVMSVHSIPQISHRRGGLSHR